MSFVDVSNMSDRAVQRLGHQDDCGATPAPARRRGKYAPTMLNAFLVFSAAATAHRVNAGEYVKADSGQYVEGIGWVPNPKMPNRKIIDQALSGEIPITEEDQELARKMRTHFTGLTFKILKGAILSEFDQKSLHLATAEEIPSNEINVIASLPSSYARATARQSIDDRIAECQQEYLADEGNKIITEGEVVRSIYSHQWACWFITMITKTNHSVFFSQKKDLSAGSRIKIEGKVKSHRPSFQTQLNYVRVI